MGLALLRGDGISSGVYVGTQYYQTPGAVSFTVPTGVTRISVELWGGGGGGGGVGAGGVGSAVVAVAAAMCGNNWPSLLDKQLQGLSALVARAVARAARARRAAIPLSAHSLHRAEFVDSLIPLEMLVQAALRPGVILMPLAVRAPLGRTGHLFLVALEALHLLAAREAAAGLVSRARARRQVVVAAARALRGPTSVALGKRRHLYFWG